MFEAFPKMDGFPPYTVKASRHFFGKVASQLPQTTDVYHVTKTGSVPFESWASTSFGHFPTTRGFRSQMGWELICFDGTSFGNQGRMYRKLMDIFKLMSPTQATIPDHQCIWGTPATDNEAWWNLG